MKRLFALLVCVVVCALSCGGDFPEKNEVVAVRILAARADLPYARPGETVKIDALVQDGRAQRPDTIPMRTYWFPFPCVNPPGDQYYLCYSLLRALYPTTEDLQKILQFGTSTSITIPNDALTNAFVRPGQGEKFATAFVFMVACAGKVDWAPQRGGLADNALPVRCLGANGEPLGADEYVFGFTRIFVFEQRRNALPAILSVTNKGAPVDLANGIVTPRCARASGAGQQTPECDSLELNVTFDDAIAEVDPDNIKEDKSIGQETIYVDWFTTVGEFAGNRRILFDGNLGRPKDTTIDFTPPTEPRSGRIFAVVHDNRGGTTWVDFPIDVQELPAQ